MRILLTGVNGQVGTEVARQLAGRAELVALDRAALDLENPDHIRARVREVRPEVIVNAAAYTAVDKAESEPEVARAINAVAPGVLAEEALRCGALLLHFSTDYVFDGSGKGRYVEEDAVSPINTYGRTKLEGERAIAATGCAHMILRTEWVYGPHGKNFMLTMLKVAQSRSELRVVDDQHGAPTSSLQLGRLTRELLEGTQGVIDKAALDRLREAGGVYHATAAGETTWCGFAKAIFAARANQMGAAFTEPKVIPIPSSDYPTPARRPANSLLSGEKLKTRLGVQIADWREGLAESLSAL